MSFIHLEKFHICFIKLQIVYVIFKNLHKSLITLFFVTDKVLIKTVIEKVLMNAGQSPEVSLWEGYHLKEICSAFLCLFCSSHQLYLMSSCCAAVLLDQTQIH